MIHQLAYIGTETEKFMTVMESSFPKKIKAILLTTPLQAGIVRAHSLLQRQTSAEVVKLVDTLASGASWGNPVKVQVLSSAPFLSY